MNEEVINNYLIKDERKIWSCNLVMLTLNFIWRWNLLSFVQKSSFFIVFLVAFIWRTFVVSNHCPGAVVLFGITPFLEILFCPHLKYHLNLHFIRNLRSCYFSFGTILNYSKENLKEKKFMRFFFKTLFFISELFSLSQ